MKTIVLTGTSGGLGQAFFDLLTATDARLLCISRRFLPYQQQLANGHKQRIVLLQKDLRGVQELPTAAEFADFLDGTDSEEVIFIHNAGVVEPIGAIGELDQAQMADAVHVNLIAPMVMTNAFLAAISAASCKVKVLYISSGAAKRVIDGWSVYCAAKAGAEMFMDALASQYKNDDRYVVANINPGVMDTEMQRKIRGSSDVFFPERERYVKIKEEGKLPSAEEVARRILAEYVFD